MKSTSLFDFERFPTVTVIENGQDLRLPPEEWAFRASARAELFIRELKHARNVALIGRTSLDLLLAWLGLVLAGKTPCLLQYPTAKLSRAFWRSSVQAALADCALDAAVADETVADPDSLGLKTVLPLPRDLGPASAILPIPQGGAIIQLSSGTTGNRKGIRFTLDALANHAKSLGSHLGYGQDEVMVSWLPLYHDMGFVTSWIMPLALGSGTVLMDPMDWVRAPGAFFDMVERHRGTRAYQPNFAMEVLSRHYRGQDVSSLKEVVSCSEPTRASSLRAFSQATGLPSRKLANSYAMAENVFAVSHGRNPRILTVHGRECVSCGPPTAGVSVKVRGGELWVKSQVSMTKYVDGTRIADEEGYYPTGDMGTLDDGEVVVFGRRRDVAIVGGEKYFLSDIDHAVFQEAPWTRGRACSFAEDREDLGTQRVQVLMEHERFWEQGEHGVSLAHALAQRTGLAQIRAAFVPKGFITKTSSGKVNRVITARNWELAAMPDRKAGQESPEAPGTGPVLDDERLLSEFPALAGDGHIGELLDSLGYLSLTLRLAEHGLTCVPDESVGNLRSRLEHKAANGKIFLILSLSCAQEDRFFSPEYLDELSKALGVPVHYERLITPRSGVLLSDLVFHDWFMPRDEDDRHAPFKAAIRTLSRAGVLVMGETPELRHPRFNAYPALTHDFARDPSADRLALRWPGYFRNHHLLPVKILTPHDFDPANATRDLEWLSSYLGAPLFRMAYSQEFEQFTHNWEYRRLHKPGTEFMRFYKDPAPDHRHVRAAFKDYLVSLPFLKLTCGEPSNRFQRLGASHYCGWLVEEELTRRAEAFCAPFRRIGFAGPECSLPGLSAALAAAGKDIIHLHDGTGDDSGFDAFVQAGYAEALNRGKPSIRVMDHPVSRLSRYTRSPFPVPPEEISEFLNSGASRWDIVQAQTLLDAHLPHRPRLAVAHGLKARQMAYLKDMNTVDSTAGIPEWLGPALAGRTVYRDKNMGEPFFLQDFFKPDAG